jgi:hypothetical protein
VVVNLIRKTVVSLNGIYNKLKTDERAQIIIRNGIGQIVEMRSLNAEHNNTSFDISRSGAGVYSVQLITSSGRVKSLKVAYLK